MTGPQHYREAERFAEIATEHADDSPGQMSALAFAQVHATLALTAASAMGVDEVGTKADWDAAFRGVTS